LILIADGTEEMEFTIIYDTLVRTGIECTSTCVPKGLSPYGRSFPTCVTLDSFNAGPDKYDALIIPGGMEGAATMAGSTEAQNLWIICAGIHFFSIHRTCRLRNIYPQGSKVAITAKLPGQPIASYPSVQSEFPIGKMIGVDITLFAVNFDYKEQSVVVSNAVPGKMAPVTRYGGLLAKRDEVVGPMIVPTGIGYPF
ncbi:hypothetical protein M405DRAFT_830098, partial [Rhizopogon salebrosus TDB-379]